MFKKKDEKKRISPDETRDMQRVILGILEAIDKVCREHHLRYYMIAGTMLGAVRHHGFIPWDDDADVALPRKDYDILCRHANEWLPKEYELVSYLQDKSYPYQFARIQDNRTTYILRRAFNFVGGVPVDVFPLDGMTDSKWKRKVHYLRYRFLIQLKYYSIRDPFKHGKRIDCLFFLLFHKMFPIHWIEARIDKLQHAYDWDKGKLVADHDNAPDRGILSKDVYGTPVSYAFENTHLYGVANPDAYLSYCYGDYMKLPASLPPQNFRLMDLKKPYKEWLQEHHQNK